jgi:hypothetical protein
MLAVSFDSCCCRKFSTVISLSGPVVYILVHSIVKVDDSRSCPSLDLYYLSAICSTECV